MPLTLHAAAEQIRQGALSPLDLLDTCLTQIDRLEPRVHAWVLVDRDGARADAERLAVELRQGHWRGPLHGIPVGIKDIIDVFDWPTAAGSRRWERSVARRDATVVERLRQAGAVLVGKTVTTAYASFDPPPTRNPWRTERTPGGSSSGSAAAVACGMCVAALGSQTGGSITRPASYCGVAGCKPTFGRVSVAGVAPLAPSMDHVGPMGVCVRDLAIVLQVIAGPDPYDPGCAARAVPDYAARLAGVPPGERRGVSPPVPAPALARPRGLFESLADPAVVRLMDRTAEAMRASGATVTDVALPAGFGEVLARHRTVMAVEAAAYHGPRLKRHPDDYPPHIRELLEEGLACPAPEYARCKAHQRQLLQDMVGCLEGFDALLTPATTGPAPDAATTGDPAFNSPWSYTGLPTVSFPAGWSAEGLPLAVQFVGRPWGEADLLAVAAWCEGTLGFDRKEPATV
jgi:aspartyl-tRNA(Asn)/glutamyl-tRNA(Gln) amidotransferase subunit A